MQRINPQAFVIRTSQALRGIVKNGFFFAPHADALWQSDLNQVLQDYGILTCSVVCVGSAYWLKLVAMTSKLSHITWEQCNLRAVLVNGGRLPDVWTTDKGSETHVTAYAVRAAKQWANGGLPPAVPAHKYLDSTQQSIVESRNNSINVTVNLHFKLVVVYMERVLHAYTRTNPQQKGALQALLLPVVQHGLDQLRSAWNAHMVRSAHSNKGIPNRLRRERPHPGPQTMLPIGVDWTVEYENATGSRLRREPSWAAARDPLYGQPQRQAARAAAIMQMWGSVGAAYADVVHTTGRSLFIPSYLVYLQYT